MIHVGKATTKTDIDIVQSIRQEVFVKEQHCPPELEWEYENESVHFLATFNGVPAGTARWRQTEHGYKLERFAVLRDFRGMKVGESLIKAVLNDVPSDALYVYLHAQVQACGLYEKFGFVKKGAEFEEAGIPHFKMLLKA